MIHSNSKPERTIGILLIAGAIGVFTPYTVLTMTFDYPDILRRDPGDILTAFHAGGAGLIWTWWAFALLGLPLLIAYILLGQKLEAREPNIRWATTLGIIGLIVQMIGLLRWTFVVPVLAANFVEGQTEMAKEAAKVAFQVVHQYGGVVLGEHLGQLFTIAWTVLMASAFERLKIFPKWLTWFAFIAAFIYLLAQAELFATVMPSFPVWNLAGFIGSSLWLIWLIMTGVKLLHRTFD